MLDLPAAGGRHDVPPVVAACGSLAATPTTTPSASRWPCGARPNRRAPEAIADASLIPARVPLPRPRHGPVGTPLDARHGRQIGQRAQMFERDDTSHPSIMH